jgi:hypothetical protein
VTLPALATQADAASWGYTLPSGTGDALLSRASVRIRRAAGQPITPSTVTVQLPVERRIVLLPAPPVIAVQTVKAVNPADGTLTVLTGWVWDGERLNLPYPAIIPAPCRAEVTYSRGWTVVSDGIVELTCQVATRLSLTPPGMDVGVRERKVDDYSETYAVEQLDIAGDLLPGELTALRRELGPLQVWVATV